MEGRLIFSASYRVFAVFAADISLAALLDIFLRDSTATLFCSTLFCFSVRLCFRRDIRQAR
jgi:hypothetical protein